MLDVATGIGIGLGIFGSLTALGSMIYQRRQTQLMEVGLERALESPEGDSGTSLEKRLRMIINNRLSSFRSRMRAEIKQDVDPRLTEIERLLQIPTNESALHLWHEIATKQASLDALLRDIQDAQQKIAAIEQHIVEEAERTKYAMQMEGQRILEELVGAKQEIDATEQRIVAQSGRYDSAITAHGSQIEELRSRTEDLQKALGSEENTRVVLRLIGQRLMELSNQGY